jgi:hypothetical protein
MLESGKWYVAGVWSNGFLPCREWGPPKKHSIPDPPPLLKADRSGGSEKYCQPFIGAPTTGT